MFQFSIFKKNLSGFTLIEALALLFVFAVITAAFFEAYSAGTRMIIESKRRLGATALANQKMEIIRSLDYDNVGTATGVPSGDISEYENINVNGVQYRVHTFVQYVDDAFDGKTGGNPNDAIPNDYKRVRLSVSWGSMGTDQTISTFANISPNGVETAAGGGVLSINILDSSGAGVAGASVHIVNTAGGVNITTDTDDMGNITLPGTPAGTYQLTVSKNGYYGTMTYPPYPTSPFIPIDEHIAVVDGALNPKSMTMERASDITIRSKDFFGTAVPNIDFQMTGGKILGTDSGTLANVYEYNQTLSTNASGVKDIAAQSYGQYTLTESDARYQFYKLVPSGEKINVFDALAGETTVIDMLLLDTQIGSVKVIVTSAADSSPVAGAVAHLTNAGLGYDATAVTDQYGFAYFPATMPELAAETYDLEVSAAGFSNNDSTVSVNGGLVIKEVGLNP